MKGGEGSIISGAAVEKYLARDEKAGGARFFGVLVDFCAIRW